MESVHNPVAPIAKLVAVYARVSTARQEEDGTIATQLAAVREYARQHGLSIVKEYIDDGWSGDTLIRPNLDSLRQEVKSRLWEGVLIYDPDRLARRYSYQELVMDELIEAGVEVMFVTMAAPRDDLEKAMNGVRGVFAEYERIKIAERFRLGKLRKVKEGHILVSQPLYGYRYVQKKDKQHGYYEINEEEARVVRLIFKWVADEGLTIRAVVRRLQDLGIKPRKSERGVWNTSTLTTMFRNRAYMGEAHWRSSIAVVPQNPINKEKYRRQRKSSRKPRPKDEWLTVPVPAILDEELFERAQVQLKSHATLSSRNKKYEYLFGGKTRCTCGQKRIGAARKKGQYLYYDCCDKILCFPLPRICHENPINARVLDRLVWEKIASLMSSSDLLVDQAKRWMASRESESTSSMGDAAMLQKRIDELKKQEDRYNKAYGAGLYTMEQLKQYALPIREEINGLEEQAINARQAANRIRTDLIPDEADIDAFVEEAQKVLLDLSFEQKRAIVLNTVEEVVGNQKEVEVHGYIPINSNGWLNVEDRNRRIAERGEIHAF